MGMIVNVHHSPRAAKMTGSPLYAKIPKTPFLVFERPRLTRTSPTRAEAGQFASGLIRSHDTQMCLVYLRVCPMLSGSHVYPWLS